MKKENFRNEIDKMDENEKKEKIPINLEIKENYKKRSIKKILSPKI